MNLFGIAVRNRSDSHRLPNAFNSRDARHPRQQHIGEFHGLPTFIHVLLRFLHPLFRHWILHHISPPETIFCCLCFASATGNSQHVPYYEHVSRQDTRMICAILHHFHHTTGNCFPSLPCVPMEPLFASTHQLLPEPKGVTFSLRSTRITLLEPVLDWLSRKHHNSMSRHRTPRPTFARDDPV